MPRVRAMLAILAKYFALAVVSVLGYFWLRERRKRNRDCGGQCKRKP